MELRSVHKTFHHGHLGEEKQQMLNLNGRLEAYLSRVKLLEEDNALLTKEIQTLRRSSHGALNRRKGLEEELRQARLEVDAAWRDKVHTEMDVCRLAEELQALDLQRQREAQAQVKAKMKLQQSRKELEEEQRAQMWLREKVSQLEHEMRHLIQTHQDDVAHLEATLAPSRATMPPAPSLQHNQIPNLRQLGLECSQRASRAWQEATEVYEGQLIQLEESLNQARSQLTQVGQEKQESQLKLQALKKEIVSAQEVRQHLERTVAQQGHKFNQEIQQLQEHLEGLEVEKEELGQQMDRVVMENRGLLQVKMSLSLEVATYRALLDGESLRGDVSAFNLPGNVSITDAAFSPRGVKKNYQTQLPFSHKSTSFPSVCHTTGSRPKAAPVTPTWSRKPEPSQISMKPAKLESPYPKILQEGAVENFRPQEVQETVTYAEPLSPPDEQEAPAESASDKDGEADWRTDGIEPSEEKPVIEPAVSQQVEFGLNAEGSVNEEVNEHQFTTSDVPADHGRNTEEPCSFSDEPDKDVSLQILAEKEDIKELHAPADSWVEEEFKGKHVQEETSDSETEAVLEPNFDSRTSSPLSEYEPEESVFNKVTEVSGGEQMFEEEEVEEVTKQESSIVSAYETDAEDKLYPDGEEMDTWDSVMERKVDLQTGGLKEDEEKQQHAEPEEDLSTREQEHEKKETRPVVASNAQQDDNMASSEGQCAAVDEEHAPLPDLRDEDDDEEEDSQNVSVSWRTELESDSYAQDNTLADTRPLIRYKSDETDANTQAHMDESESSEGELEKKIEEAGSDMWNEGKTKRFGTMEDLCEGGEVMDEEFDVGHTHTENSHVDQGTTVCEHVTPANETEGEEEMNRKVRGECSDEETEEVTKPSDTTHVGYDEELETDRLVEEELENLATDSYSFHFAQQQQVGERQKLLHLWSKSDENRSEEDKKDFSPSVKGNQELPSSTTVINQPCDILSDASEVTPQTEAPADDKVQHEDQEVPEKKEEEDEHNVSLVTHADMTEDHSNFSDLISRLNMEEMNNSEEPNFVSTADQENLQDKAVPTEENLQDEAVHTEENLQDEAVPTEENLQDECVHTEDNLRDEAVPTEENLQDEPNFTEKNLQDEAAPTEENLQDESVPTKENLKDESVLTKENLQDEAVHTKENLQGEAVPTEENLQGEAVPTEENLQDEAVPTEKNLQDESVPTKENLKDESVLTKENLQDEAAHIEENLQGEAVPTEKNLQDESVPTKKNLKDESVLTKENLQDEAAHIEENLQDEAVPTEENLQGEAVPTEENLQREAVPTEENLQDECVHTEDNLQDEAVPTKENLQDEAVPTEENLQDEAVPTEENLQDEAVPTEENLQDEAIFTEKNLQDEDVPTEENLQDEAVPTEENLQVGAAPTKDNLQDEAVHTEETEAEPLKPFTASEEHLTETEAHCQEFPEVPETTEWDIIENPEENIKIQDLNKDNEADSVLQDDGGSHENIMTHKEELLEISPDFVPEENNIFVVKDSTDLQSTNSKDSSPQGFFSSGVKSDFWVSSLETGATYQPDEACDEAAEQTGQNLRFDDNLVWGELENSSVVTWNSRVEIDSSKASKKDHEKIRQEAKQQVMCRNVVEEEFVHSEESDDEGGSWSSGEETV